MPGTKTLNLEMTEEVHARLESLRDRVGADNLVEVIRRALAVYEHLWAEREKGNVTVVKSPEGERDLFLR